VVDDIEDDVSVAVVDVVAALPQANKPQVRFKYGNSRAKKIPLGNMMDVASNSNIIN
jgi:hypothetical protein